VKRFIFVSSLSAREPQLSAYGASKARAEKLVRASGLDWTIVRPPAIYGPRDQELLALFKAVKWGLVPMPQRQGRASYIHVDDLARLLLALVPGGEGISAQTFEPDDGEPGGWAHNEFARALGHAVGRRPLVLHFAPNLLAFAGRASRWLLGDKAKLTPDRASYMSHPDWVSSPAAQVPKALWQPQISLADGLADTAAWYRSAGWL
jgi:nucleoside-diphosphate-sugar epimerase